jgi:hypothetical protein
MTCNRRNAKARSARRKARSNSTAKLVAQLNIRKEELDDRISASTDDKDRRFMSAMVQILQMHIDRPNSFGSARHWLKVSFQLTKGIDANGGRP